MEVATGFLVEIKELLAEARRYVAQAKTEDPFTRDDTLQYASKSIRTAWTIYNRLGTQISRVPVEAARKALISDQLNVKADLEELGALINASKVTTPATGFSPTPGANALHGLYAPYMADLYRQETDLQRAEVQLHTAVETSADILMNLNAQKETIEHAQVGNERAGEAFFEGALAAKQIKHVANKHGIIMTVLLSVLGVCTGVAIIMRFTLKIL